MGLVGTIFMCVAAVSYGFWLARREKTKWGWFQFSLIVALAVFYILKEIP